MVSWGESERGASHEDPLVWGWCTERFSISLACYGVVAVEGKEFICVSVVNSACRSRLTQE